MTARYLTTSDVARILGVTPGAVRLMHKRGDLPIAERTLGGVHLFLRVEVDRLAAVRREREVARSRKAECESACRTGGSR